LLQECLRIGGCPTGEARLTSAYNLPARFVIHTVGPVWHGGNDCEAELLASCYKNSLLLAKEYHAASVAFPAISTGVYGYPLAAATAIAIKTVHEFLQKYAEPQEVVFCCFSRNDYIIYQIKLAELGIYC
jgi:O-acetyl-ADP-ribose deacetylase (regulator of RNase III)